MVDVSNALSAGPFSPERAGALQTVDLMKMCFSGEFTQEEMKSKLVGGGGLVAYLGTIDAMEVVARIESGDREAELVLDAMVYQTAKEIGAMSAALDGQLDAVVLTGGIAKNDYVVDRLRSKIAFLGEVVVIPGEDELKALALGCLRVLRGEEMAKTYPQTVEDGSTASTQAEER
jgi:butyrate kinase